MNRLVSIQCLRFAAATGVVLTHCSSGKFLFGGFGVDLFFVISGFIITKVMARREALAFVKDRFSRIYPIYWLSLIPLIIAGWDGDGPRLLTSITLWPVFGQFRTSYLGVGWTLHFELLFYAAAALVLWRRWTLPIILIGYAAAMFVGLSTSNALFDFIGSPMVLEFLMGVGIALLPTTRFQWLGGLVFATGLAAAVWGSSADFGSIENMFNGKAIWRWAAWGVPGALILWGLMQFEGLLKGRLFAFGAAGGDASYALYLSHPVFLMLRPANPYLLAALGPPLLIAAGFAVHYWIEKPLLRWTRALLAGPTRKAKHSNKDGTALADP